MHRSHNMRSVCCLPSTRPTHGPRLPGDARAGRCRCRRHSRRRWDRPHVRVPRKAADRATQSARPHCRGRALRVSRARVAPGRWPPLGTGDQSMPTQTALSCRLRLLRPDSRPMCDNEPCTRAISRFRHRPGPGERSGRTPTRTADRTPAGSRAPRVGCCPHPLPRGEAVRSRWRRRRRRPWRR